VTVRCPLADCDAENAADADLCVRCGTPLRHYARLAGYADQLFNRGLAAAAAGDLSAARDLFAAVVHWCPFDVEARNALALACFRLADHTAARAHWTAVLDRRPDDQLATRGLARLAPPPSS
jgi:cytochrome c-type biogenesis protein CcmH/NrfG